MINLFDHYNQASWDLHFSLIKAGYINPTIALIDDGFLPEDVTSPYQYVTGFTQSLNGRPLYYNELSVPETWEIIGHGDHAEVMDLGVKKASIHYANPTHKRWVKEVDWFDEQGRLLWKDRYNQFGYRFAQTQYSGDGQAIQTSYFNSEGQEVLSENHRTSIHILNREGQTKVFKTKVDFVIAYLRMTGYDLSRICYNSLSTPFLVSYYMDRGESQDVLFWQEPIYDEIPGNMTLLLKPSSKSTKIIFQNQSAYQKALPLLSDQDKNRVSLLGFMYPFKATRKIPNKAMVLTNSDQLEGLMTLVTSLPELDIHIGALTEMSSQLMSFGQYPNVTLYPNITTEQVKQLTETSTFYLDINYYAEILSAVRAAFEHRLLIYAFEETKHQEQFLAPEHLFPKEQVDQLVSALKEILTNPDKASMALEKQQEAAHIATPSAYQLLIG